MNMMRNDFRKEIWSLADQVRGTTYSRNLAFSVLRLVFLKYALDNFIGASTKEDMLCCGRAQKMFALRDVENGIETIIPVLQYIDRAYGFEEILSHPLTIEAYAKELFGFDKTRQKKSASDESFKALIGLLGNLDLEEKAAEPVGSVLVEALLESINMYSDKNSFAAEYTTSHSISALAKAILKVDDKDQYIDFASGAGISTLDIVGDANPRIINIDRDGSVVAVSAMLYIMKGYDKLQVICDDSLANVVQDARGNKLFVDAPLAAKIAKTCANEYSDSSLATINRVMHDYLTYDGIAVITLPSGTLFQMRSPAVSLRDELVNLGMVKAVITLPPLWNYTAVNTNLLVVSKKEMPSRNVVFVDAVQEAKKTSSKNRANTITEELVKQIVSVIENRETVEGFSCVVPAEEIAKNGFNLVPATYISCPVEEDTITMEEIDAQLDELYRQLLK